MGCSVGYICRRSKTKRHKYHPLVSPLVSPPAAPLLGLLIHPFFRSLVPSTLANWTPIIYYVTSLLMADIVAADAEWREWLDSDQLGAITDGTAPAIAAIIRQLLGTVP